jgi:N-acetylneuraminate synthase
MAHLRGLNLPVLLFQCTTAYPCPPEKVGLNLIPFFQDRYRCPVGLSDHSGTVYAGLAAATLGVQAVEVHVTFSREMFGPDVPASLTTAELRQLVQGIRFIEAMRAHPVNKDELAGEMAPLRAAFTKSVVARADLEAGTILAESMLVLKKPGGGIPGNKLPELIGRRLRRNVRADEPILERDLGKSD